MQGDLRRVKPCELLGQLVEEVTTVHMPITSGSVRTIFRRPYLTLSSGGSSFGFLLSPSEKQKFQLGVAVDIQRTTIPRASASHGYADGGDKHGKAQRASCKEPPWKQSREELFLQVWDCKDTHGHHISHALRVAAWKRTSVHLPLSACFPSSLALHTRRPCSVICGHCSSQ